MDDAAAPPKLNAEPNLAARPATPLTGGGLVTRLLLLVEAELELAALLLPALPPPTTAPAPSAADLSTVLVLRSAFLPNPSMLPSSALRLPPPAAAAVAGARLTLLGGAAGGGGGGGGGAAMLTMSMHGC